MTNFCHHIGIFTNNPQKLKKFYTKKLGFEPGETKIVPKSLMRKIFGISSPCTLSKLKLGQVVIEILSPGNLKLKRRSNSVSGYNHWSLEVQSKEAFALELKKKDVAVLDFKKDGRSIFFFKDPEGNLIELYEA